jgi:hypothetical protein
MMAGALVFALSSAASAATHNVIPPGNSAIAQYTEAIPSGGGGTPAAKVPTDPTTPASQLSVAAARAVRGRSTARHELARFVGATAPNAKRSSTHGVPPLPSGTNVAGSSALGSVVHSLNGSGGMGLALPVILILLACGFGAATVVRLRRS